MPVEVVVPDPLRVVAGEVVVEVVPVLDVLVDVELDTVPVLEFVNQDIHPESARLERSGKKILISGRWVKLDIISSICL